MAAGCKNWAQGLRWDGPFRVASSRALFRVLAGLFFHCAWIAAVSGAIPMASATGAALVTLAAAPQSGTAASSVSSVRIDPCLGTHWLLVADAAHPDRPGRWVQLASNASATRVRSVTGSVTGKIAEKLEASSEAGSPEGIQSSASARKAPVGMANVGAIHAGDHLLVRQDTQVLHARLAAVALESAEAGQPVRVRLLTAAQERSGASGLTGAVLVVRVLGPGEAVWQATKMGL